MLYLITPTIINPMKSKGIVIILILLGSLELFCQDMRLAVIHDSDGYTNVREGKSNKSEIIGRINTNEPFSIKDSGESWIEIYKPTYFKPLVGFVHKSRIQVINELPRSGKRHIIKNIFEEELRLIKLKDWEGYHDHHEPRFDFILDFAGDFIVSTKDNELLTLLIQTIKINVGSADEKPISILGGIFLREPDWTIEQIERIGVDADFIDKLEFGFDNAVFDLKENPSRISELKAKLAKLK